MFDVEVHTPDRPVVLVLAARHSALWMVRASPETNIAGVWLAGDGKHEVIGIAAAVPMMKGADTQRDCRTFYVSDGNSEELRDRMQSVFGRKPKALIAAKEGDIRIGDLPTRVRQPRAPISATDTVRASGPSLPGDRGIEQLLREGKLKPATLSDYKRWVKRDSPQDMPSGPGGTYLRRTYLVKGPITFPSGLHGAHRATFILLPGVPYPEGDPGHSQIIQAE